jgi:hypothetical protein
VLTVLLIVLVGLLGDYRVLKDSCRYYGVEYGLVYKPGSTQIFWICRYVIPNSDATKDIKRGDLFYAVNGTQLTVNNYSGLLALKTIHLSLASFNGGLITPNGRSVSLTKTIWPKIF